MNQPLLPFTGEELRNGGMQVALDSANLKHQDWGIYASNCLDRFLLTHAGQFMGEDVRKFAHEECGLPFPPSARSWGSVIFHAAKANKIRRIGFGPVKNSRAHRANAAIWLRVVSA